MKSESYNPDDAFCGCGTCKDLVDTALSAAEKTSHSTDCARWILAAEFIKSYMHASATIFSIEHKKGQLDGLTPSNLITMVQEEVAELLAHPDFQKALTENISKILENSYGMVPEEAPTESSIN